MGKTVKIFFVARTDWKLKMWLWLATEDADDQDDHDDHDDHDNHDYHDNHGDDDNNDNLDKHDNMRKTRITKDDKDNIFCFVQKWNTGIHNSVRMCVNIVSNANNFNSFNNIKLVNNLTMS